jgi:enoyl-CoA hydratase/carnithine racemase
LQKESEQGARALTEFVKIEKGLGPEGRIAVVPFDRGDGINALSPEALRQLTDTARSFEDDGGTSVVVLTGAPKAFSAGFDLKDAEGRSRRTMDIGSLRRHLKLGPRLTRAWQEMEQITIGAIEGFCIGGGVALEVVDSGKALDAAMELAAKVATQPPLSVAMTKLTVNRLAHALDDLASHMDADQFALASLTEDHKEGVAAFLGRRKPRFRAQ